MEQTVKNMPENKASLNTENPTILKTTAVKRKLRMVPVIPVMLTVIMGLLVLGVASITTCLDWHSSKNINYVYELTHNVFADNKAQIVHDYKEKLTKIAYFNESKTTKSDFLSKNATNIDIDLSNASIKNDLVHYVQKPFMPLETDVSSEDVKDEYNKIRAKVYSLPNNAFSKISEKLSKIKKSYENRLRLAQKSVKNGQKVDNKNIFADKTVFSVDDFEPIGKVVNEIRMSDVWIMVAIMAMGVIIFAIMVWAEFKRITKVG